MLIYSLLLFLLLLLYCCFQATICKTRFLDCSFHGIVRNTISLSQFSKHNQTKTYLCRWLCHITLIIFVKPLNCYSLIFLKVSFYLNQDLYFSSKDCCRQHIYLKMSSIKPCGTPALTIFEELKFSLIWSDTFQYCK